MSEITIKKGTIKAEMRKNDLVQVGATSDGIVFKFTNGIHMYFTDPYMPIETKRLIETYNNYNVGNIVFDLDSRSKPVKVILE